jgi:hypothetical protein
MNQPITISAAIAAVLSSGVALVALFWPDQLTPVVQAAIILFGNSVIILGAAVWAARQSTPIATPTLPTGTVVTVETPKGEANYTTKV